MINKFVHQLMIRIGVSRVNDMGRRLKETGRHQQACNE